MSSYLDRPLTHVRRRDRQLTDADWIERFLVRAPVGHLAVAWQGQPMIHTNLFWYDGRAVWLHTAPVGKLRAVVEAGTARACFTVTELGRILPAGTPFDFSTEYASVVCYGSLEVVKELAVKEVGLEGLMAKYAPHLKPGTDYQPMPPSDIERTTVFRMTIEERVAKHNVKPADHPAYPYPGESFIDAERAAGRVTMKWKEIDDAEGSGE
jgi:nitroimidazol reductase NimA-like FMN-containing flavoprotein (pyridoxamine 5'-phosphate oxidase superfamily)